MTSALSKISSPKPKTHSLDPVMDDKITDTKIIKKIFINKSDSHLLSVHPHISKRYMMSDIRLKNFVNIEASPSAEVVAKKCFKERKRNFGEVLSCYRDAVALKPLQYTGK